MIACGSVRGSVLFAPAYRLVQELLAAKRDLDLPRWLRALDLPHSYGCFVKSYPAEIQEDCNVKLIPWWLAGRTTSGSRLPVLRQAQD